MSKKFAYLTITGILLFVSYFLTSSFPPTLFASDVTPESNFSAQTSSVTPNSNTCNLTADGKYDILCYMNPPNGSDKPNRNCTSATASPGACYPVTIKEPVQVGNGSNGGGNYQKTNTFYYLKDRPGSNGTSFEKFGYDDSRIWIMRDADWNDGETNPNPANGNEYVGKFPTNPNNTTVGNCNTADGGWCLPDASGAVENFYKVQAGTPSSGLWASRYMSPGEFVNESDGLGNIYPNNNIPTYVKAFLRDRTGSNSWKYVPEKDFPSSGRVRLVSVGNMNFGGIIGTRNYIVIGRGHVFNCSNCPPSKEERDWYAEGIGLVKFELWSLNSNYSDNGIPDSYVQWSEAPGSNYNVSGPTDVSFGSGVNGGAIDSEFDHVYVEVASQLDSTKAKVYFTTTDNPQYKDDQGQYKIDQSATVFLNNSIGARTVYDFNFSGNPKWDANKLTGIRFSPSEGTSGATWYPDSCGCINLYSIRIGRETGPADDSAGAPNQKYLVQFIFNQQNGANGFSTNDIGANFFPAPPDSGWVMAPTGNNPYVDRTLISAAPSQPSNIAATAISPGQINLTWTDNSNNEQGFRLERKTTAGASPNIVDSIWQEAAFLPANTNSYQDSLVITGTTNYIYRVRACISGKCSNYSNNSNTTSTPAIPARPLNLSATTISTNQINLTWTDNSTNEQEFRIERKTGSGGAWAQIASVGPNTTTYQNNTGLSPETTYYYQIRACFYLCSDYSTQTSSTTLLPTPTSLAVVAATSSQINLSWVDNSSTETRFEIQRSTTSSFTSPVTLTSGQNTTSYSDTGLSLGTTYYYRVRACSALACSIYNPSSGGVSATTLVAASLAFVSVPGTSEPSYNFTTQPMVKVIDVNGNLVTNFSGSLSLSIKAGTGNATATLNPPANTTVSVSGGTANFTGLSISKIGNSYQLRANAISGVTNPTIDSSAFNVVGKLIFSTQPPASTLARSAFSGVLTVQVQRPSDSTVVNNYDGPITLAIKSGTGGTGSTLTLNNTTTPVVRNANGTNGSVSFTNELTIDRIGSGFQLTASSTDPLTQIDSSSFTITGNLVFATPTPVNPPPAYESFTLAVTLKGGDGTTLSYYNGPIYLTLTTNPTGAFPFGNPNGNAVNGVATFNYMAISKPGTGYVITGSIPNLASGNITFNVGAPLACTGFVVNSTSDASGIDTYPTSCNTITLRAALGRATAGKTIRVDRNALGSGVLSITLNTALPAMGSGVGLDGGCLSGTSTVTGLSLTTGGLFSFAFQIGPNGYLRGVKLVGPTNGIHLVNSGGGNQLSCTVVGP